MNSLLFFCLLFIVYRSLCEAGFVTVTFAQTGGLFSLPAGPMA
jgi:hypothetical protein